MENENQHTYDNGFHPKEVKLKEDYLFYNTHFWFRFLAYIVKVVSRFWLFFPKVFLGYRVKGRKNKSKVKGAIVVSNHIFVIDALLLVSSFWRRKVYVTMLQSNLGFGLASKYMRIGAAVPIPTDRRLLRKFNEETVEILKKGKNVLFYPEAALMPYCDHIRNFLPGAFHYALLADAPILPCCFTFHKPRGLYKLFRKKPTIHLNILEPYYLKQCETRNETIHQATTEVQNLISEYFVNHSDYYYENGVKINHSK